MAQRTEGAKPLGNKLGRRRRGGGGLGSLGWGLD
jgi:hypothetical protein